MTTVHGTLELARSVISDPSDVLQGRHSRAAALLMRQSLEEALDALWAQVDPAIARCSMRAQLLVLPTVIDPHLAGAVAQTYGELSTACHANGAGAPTISEIEQTEEVVERMHAEVGLVADITTRC